MAEYVSANRERINELNRLNYKRNGDKWKKQRTEYYYANKEKHILRRRKNQKTRNQNPKYRIANALRCGLYNALKLNKKIKKTFELLGCDIETFKKYLQSKIMKGMTMENYGTVWHIDHIIPVSKFDLSKDEEQKICFHYSNMQPMFAVENMKKRDKLVAPQIKLIL